MNEYEPFLYLSLSEAGVNVLVWWWVVRLFIHTNKLIKSKGRKKFHMHQIAVDPAHFVLIFRID